MKCYSFLYLIILSIFIKHCSTVSIQHSINITAQQTYLASLLNTQKTINQHLLSLTSFIKNTNSNVTLFQSYPNIQRQILKTGLHAQKVMLHNINSYLIVPMDKKVWDCNMLQQDQLDNINSLINQIQRNITILQQIINNQQLCLQNYQLIMQIQYLNLYIDHLAQLVNANCGTSDQNIIYVVNKKNQYYTYGSQGQNNYKDNIQNLLEKQYTKIQCPEQQPYPNNKNNQCIACPQDNIYYYDLSQEQCLLCPDGQMFVISSHTCLWKAFNSNLTAGNYAGVSPAWVAGLDTCPTQAPFYNGKKCVGCSTESFYDFQANQCMKCPTNTVFDSRIHLCLYKKYNNNLNPNSSNICCGTFLTDPNAEQCIAQKPFFNGKQCITCQLPAYFSIQTLNCILCPQDKGFSLIQKQCIDKKYLQQTFTSTISQQLQNYVGTPPVYDKQYQKIINCPINIPYFNTINCIACQLPSYYNFNTNKCQLCQNGYKFDILNHTCRQILTSQMNNNMQILNNFIGKIPDYNNTLSTCPKDKPFYDGINCMQCVLPKYVDFSTKTCKQCQQNYTFNTINRQCNIIHPYYYTNIKIDNIFYNGDFNVITNQIKQLSNNPNTKQCERQIPFYNAVNNTCMKCTKQLPLFDYKYNRCTACSNNAQFNKQARTCMMKGQIYPTIERMMMNTIGWG